MVSASYYAFDLDPKKNTGTLYIASHVLSGVLLEIYTIVAASFTHKHFIPGLLSRTAFWLVFNIPYLVFLGYPMDGTRDRDLTRRILWITGLVCEMLIQPASVIFFKYAHVGSIRIGINIEHMAERYGLLVVIVLGEIMINFLDDFQSSYALRAFADLLVCILLSFCLFYLYFRAEVGKHKQHALRRHAFSGVLWGWIHFPIAIFFVSCGQASNGLLAIAIDTHNGKADGSIAYEFQTLVGTSYSSIYFLLCILNILHLEHTSKNRKVANISKVFRTLVRVLCGVLILVLSLTVRMTASSWLWVLTIISLFSVSVEEYGRLKHNKAD
jgi:low temperature requirement protein LtrA